LRLRRPSLSLLASLSTSNSDCKHSSALSA
jgi:hypothetical protein